MLVPVVEAQAEWQIRRWCVFALNLHHQAPTEKHLGLVPGHLRVGPSVGPSVPGSSATPRHLLVERRARIVRTHQLRALTC